MTNILKIFLLIFTLSIFIACENEETDRQSQQNHNTVNTDKTKQNVIIFSQNLNKDKLIKEAQKQNSAAIIALSIFKDSSYIPYFINFLSSSDNKLIESTAFSVGEIGDSYYTQRLFNTLNNKNLSEDAKSEIIKALGKIGNTEILNKIAQLNPNNEKIMQAQSLAFYYFAQRGIVTDKMIDKTMSVLNSALSEDIKVQYTYWITLDNKINLTKYSNIIIGQINTAEDIRYKANLIFSLKYVSTSQARKTAKEFLKSTNPLFQCNAIKSLYSISYDITSALLENTVKSKNYDVAVTSAKYFLLYGKPGYGNYYFSLSKNVKVWKARTILLQAALRYSSDKSKISNSIISGYNATENIYEKAALLYALSEDIRSYKFVMNQTLTSPDKIISTTGIQSLINMRQSASFKAVASALKKNQNINLYDEFDMFFKEALQKGDNAMTYYSARVWNTILQGENTAFLNTYFFKQALASIVLPRDNKAYRELCKSLKTFSGENCKQQTFLQPNFNWNAIFSQQENIIVKVKTTKGKFKISLDTKNAPVTVYTFIELIKAGYYKNTPVYKRVPCSLVSLGGRRGDGWPDKNIPLVKENLQAEFQEGSVAMNSIDNIFSSVNWFVTLEPRSDLNGNYTIFGKVIQGMDVVNKLTPGDKIIEIQIE